MKIKEYRVNREIKANFVRLIDNKGKQVGIVSIKEALEMAEEIGLDLVEVVPSSNPPVCKIMDYGKFKYQEKKKRKGYKSTEMKMIKMHINIHEDDLAIKIRKAKEFLEGNDVVRVMIILRGREIKYKDMGMQLIYKFIDAVKDVGKIDKPPQKEDSIISVTIRPIRYAKT